MLQSLKNGGLQRVTPNCEPIAARGLTLVAGGRTAEAILADLGKPTVVFSDNQDGFRINQDGYRRG